MRKNGKGEKSMKKTNMGRKAGTAAAALALALTAASQGACAASGTLTVGVRDDIMHFGYLNPDTGKYYGMEIDLAAELAKALGYDQVKYVSVEPDNRKETLLSGEVDCLIAAYSVSETRLESLDFSPAYYTDYSSVMVEQSSLIQDMEDLVGKRIGVLDGADTGPLLAEKMIGMGLITEEDPKGSSLVKLDSYSDLSKALEEGTVDAACMDGCIARAYMEEDRVVLEEKISKEEYAVATRKDSELSEPMAEAVRQLLDDGTVERLIGKWN